jgi:O-antigen/teichoic acid export membrane protein
MSSAEPESVPAASRTRQAGWLAGGRAATAVVGLASLAALSRMLSKAEYGVYQQTILVYTLAAPFLAMGLTEALSYFLPTERQRTRGVLVENLTLLGVTGGAFAVFLLVGGNRLLAARFHDPGLEATLLVFAPYAVGMLFCDAAAPCLIVAGRTGRLAAFNVAARTLALVLAVAAVACVSATAQAAVSGTVAAATAAGLAALGLMWLACDQGSAVPTAEGIRRQLRFAAPLGAAHILAGLTFSLDKLVVAALSASSEEYAIFANGAIEIPVVGIVAGSTTAVLMPELVRMLAEGRRPEALALWQRAMVKVACVLLPIGAFLFVLAPQIVVLLYSERYAASSLVFRIYLLMLVARIASWTVVPQAARRTGALLAITALGLMGNAALAVGLFRLFGGPGAAAGTVATMLGLLGPAYAWLTARELGCPTRLLIPWGRLARIAGLTAMPAAAVFPLGGLSWPPAAIVAVGGAIYAPACYWLLTRAADCPRIAPLEQFLKRRASPADRND